MRGMNSKRFRPTNKGVKSEKGVTLIEVIISIGILGIVSAAIVTYFTWSFGVFNYTNVKSTEESLARTQMEQIKSDNWSDLAVYATIPAPSGYYISIDTSNVTASLQKVVVTVTRRYLETAGNQQVTSVTLEGYKGDR